MNKTKAIKRDKSLTPNPYRKGLLPYFSWREGYLACLLDMNEYSHPLLTRTLEMAEYIKKMMKDE